MLKSDFRLETAHLKIHETIALFKHVSSFKSTKIHSWTCLSSTPFQAEEVIKFVKTKKGKYDKSPELRERERQGGDTAAMRM